MEEHSGRKERYRQLCETESAQVPLFLQHWWMELVCAGKQWDVLLSERGGRIAGALPYLYGRKCGLRYVLPPELTPTSGPWLDEGLTFDEQVQVLDDLAAQAAALRMVLYCQRLAPTVTNWLPFYWRGFKETTRYTYRFDPLEPVEVLMAHAQPQRRKRLELLRQQCEVDRRVGVDEFVALHDTYYRHKSGHNILAPSLVERVCHGALQRGHALLYGLRDKGGRLLAADFVVYDRMSAHSLLSGMVDAAPRNCSTLLFWELIGDLYGRTALFDFEGSMDKGNEQFYRSFGTRQVPLHCLYRSRIPFGEKLLRL